MQHRDVGLISGPQPDLASAQHMTFLPRHPPAIKPDGAAGSQTRPGRVTGHAADDHFGAPVPETHFCAAFTTMLHHPQAAPIGPWPEADIAWNAVRSTSLYVIGPSTAGTAAR